MADIDYLEADVFHVVQAVPAIQHLPGDLRITTNILGRVLGLHQFDVALAPCLLRRLGGLRLFNGVLFCKLGLPDPASLGCSGSSCTLGLHPRLYLLSRSLLLLRGSGLGIRLSLPLVLNGALPRVVIIPLSLPVRGARLVALHLVQYGGQIG